MLHTWPNLGHQQQQICCPEQVHSHTQASRPITQTDGTATYHSRPWCLQSSLAISWGATRHRVETVAWVQEMTWAAWACCAMWHVARQVASAQPHSTCVTQVTWPCHLGVGKSKTKASTSARAPTAVWWDFYFIFRPAHDKPREITSGTLTC